MEDFCKICGKKFTRKYNNEKYCSSECKNIAKKQQMKLISSKTYTQNKKNTSHKTSICKYCGKPFIKQHGNQKYCSKKCAHNRKLEQNADARMRSYHKNKQRGGDKIYGLGSGGLGAHRHKSFKLELQKIENEMHRLKIINKTTTI